MEEIELSCWLFEGRLRQCKNVQPVGLNWLCYFERSSKSHRENSISFIFLESPHQVDMKNVVKSSKHFFGYFNTLETHSAKHYSSPIFQMCQETSIQMDPIPTIIFGQLNIPGFHFCPKICSNNFIALPTSTSCLL